MEGVRIYLDHDLQIEIEAVKSREKDRTLGAAARRLLRKALEHEGRGG
jgi:hypothetical protein